MRCRSASSAAFAKDTSSSSWRIRPPRSSRGVRIQPFLLPDGLDAQELLLDLAVEIDNERREATSLLELAFQGDLPQESPSAALRLDEQKPPRLVVSLPPLPAPSTPRPPPASSPVVKSQDGPSTASSAPRVRTAVVVVDDEAPVRDVLSEELAKKGYRVFTASNPAAGAGIVHERVAAGERVMVVVDLKMPTSTERSFFGGFELIRRVQRSHPGTPVLLMAETLSEKARMRAKELGIRRLAYKPTLSKIDATLYVQDLRDFASTISEQLGKLQEDHPADGERSGGGARTGGFPSLGFPRFDDEEARRAGSVDRRFQAGDGSGGEISGARRPVRDQGRRRPRTRGFRSRSLAEGMRRDGPENFDRDRAQSGFRGGGAPRIGLSPFERPDVARRTMFEVIGRGKAKEAVLVPLLYNRATLLLLYGDNAPSGRALGDLGGLELFIAQAGMALENKLLQRKLSGADSDLVGDSGHDSKDAPNAHA